MQATTTRLAQQALRLQVTLGARCRTVAAPMARRAMSVRAEASGSGATATTRGGSNKQRRGLLGLAAATLAALSVPGV